MTNGTSSGPACGFGQYMADQGPKYDNQLRKRRKRKKRKKKA